MGRNNYRNSAVLLITGSIDINKNIPHIKLTDTTERLQQYIDSIEYAIKKYHSIQKIVFAENTNYLYNYTKLKELSKIYDKELEIISFQGNQTKTSIHGKGYGEIEIINYALKHSELINTSDIFIKLTGRIKVSNFDFVILSSYENNSFYYVSRANPPYIETIIYKIEKNLFINHFSEIGTEVSDKDGFYLEHAFLKKIESLKEHYNFGSFRVYRFLRGISGSTGNKYNSSLKSKIGNTLYSIFKRFDINNK
ncbi:hypothetical protein [Seramator thermalis]|uniref:hypothetical protein n=1 Tax=Seramator thermalis TaxID=2496270 RepID=UPI00101D1363|nr:hypothetical protein [Seramator thermalis]